MIRIKFSPQWFYGYDAAIDIVSVIVLGLLAFYAYKIFSFTGRKRDKYFALSFLSIALAFLSKVAMNLVIYYPKINKVAYDAVNLTVQYTGQSRLAYVVGFLFYRFLVLLGLYGLYYVVTKNKNRYDIAIAMGLSTIIILFSSSQYFVFHVASAIISAGIVYNYLWYNRKQESKERLRVGWAFAAIFFSQLVFILTIFHDYFYVAGQLIQLVGFLILAYTFYSIVIKK
ncbi:MAG: hypothetical protein QF915_05005 [Candidatus Woesearchaeota archaeon]|jgi:hypothetical protein|nr:hypothetical protein [Candidatus Woesearchaeota archaeon]|tara:strand:+ start:717 stop:1400 length:684 start_codon:yes stop_codon:yes gene_type:complete